MIFNISEIRNAKGFKTKIDKIKNKNESNPIKEGNYISIHFEQNNSKKKYIISNLILYNLEE